jgi:DNA polymerase-3 subunit beta
MKFVAKLPDIAGAVSFANQYAATRDLIPVLATMLFVADERGVSVTATDLDKAAADHFEAHVSRPGSVCLPAALLANAMKGTDATEVQIDAGDKEASILVGGRTRIKVPVLPAGDFPELPMLTAESSSRLSVTSDLLRRASKQVAFAREQGAGARYFLEGVAWQSINGKLEFAAGSSALMSILAADVPRDGPDMLVPMIDLPAWAGDIEVSASVHFVRFKSGCQVVASKLIDGTSPPFRDIIPRADSEILTFDRKALALSLDRAGLVMEQRQHAVLLIGRDGKCTVLSETTKGEVADEVPYDGADFQFSVNRNALKPLLSAFESETINFRWTDHSTPAVVTGPDDGGLTTVIMPLRDHRISRYVGAAKEAA